MNLVGKKVRILNTWVENSYQGLSEYIYQGLTGEIASIVIETDSIGIRNKNSYLKINLDDKSREIVQKYNSSTGNQFSLEPYIKKEYVKVIDTFLETE